MKKQLYEKGKKYTLEEIVKIFGDSLSKIIGKNAEVLIISRKIFIKGKIDTDLNAEIYFVPGTQGHEILEIKIINTKNQNSTNILRINLTDSKYNPQNQRTDLLKAGYFWTYDKEWYGYVPDFELITKDLVLFLKFINIIK